MAVTNRRIRSLNDLPERIESNSLRYTEERISGSDDVQSLQEFFDSLRKYKWFILKMTAFGVLLAALIGVLLPPTYSATAQLLVASDSSTTSGGQDSTIDTHITVLSSDAYLRRLLPTIRELDSHEGGAGARQLWLIVKEFIVFSERPTSDDIAVANLKRNLRIGQERRSRIISITYSASDSKRAAEVTNIVTQSYIDDLLRQRREDADQALSSLAVQSIDIKNNLLKAEQELSVYNAAHASAPGNNVLEWQVTTLSQQYEGVLRRRQDLTERRMMAQSDVSVLALATAPDRPISLNPIFLVPPAVITFALLGCFLAFGFSRFDRTLDNVTSTRQALRVPCIAVLPTMPHNADINLQLTHVLQRPNSQYSKIVRSAFAAMFATNPTGKQTRRVILVTSSLPAEGKTQLAWSLACCAISLGWSTLLLELKSTGSSDESPPHPPLPTASEHNEADLKYTMVPTSNGRLLQLIADPDGLSSLLEGNSGYDLVILDAPSLRREPEARLLANWADYVMVAIRWRSTTQDVALDTINQLMRDQTAHEGRLFTVLTHAATGSSDRQN